MAAKRKHAAISDEDDLPKTAVPAHIKSQEKRLIIILEKANLETVKVGKNFELLNCDDHIQIMRKHKKDPAFCRPDITHQCLLMLFDSPLNRAGLLQVYIHTEKNALIEINPQTRIPRTFKRFSGLMVQLLHKMCIRAGSGSVKLMKVIKNPVTDWLPVGCRKLGTSFHCSKLVHPRELVPKAEEPVAIVIGAMAHGAVEVDYTEESFSISEYPLSAALTCSKICSSFEEAWGIH
ncbi:ribosomal RNA small subunit methyltransferase NEP1-like [Ornithodoros turicata]|uniref:ribosomal RNA small subunit methyltransferase NEP1-like n=1 Tax=Ornithodoros turicata TaxID=34597 RepID=UPI0031393087